MPKKVLLAYISDISGHRSAALAVEHALRSLSPSTEILSINLFNYTNPYSEKVINHLYTNIIKTMPKIWEYLYDNPKVIKKTSSVKNIIHKFNSKKIAKLFNKFNPDIIVCTQAFPCGMFADFKKIYHLTTPLIGIVTDFFPHAYWAYETVNYYTVASEEAQKRLKGQGIVDSRIKLTGIPVEPKFAQGLNRQDIAKKLGLNRSIPTVLVMGGGQGLGPIKTILRSLNRLRINLQLIVVCGINKKLYKSLMRKRFSKKAVILKYVDNIDELMEISSIIITKPGGLTISEALIKELIPIIVKPIPGQEENNTKYLTGQNAAFRIKKAKEVSMIIERLILNPRKFTTIQNNVRAIAKPNAAMDIAKLILNNA